MRSAASEQSGGIGFTQQLLVRRYDFVETMRQCQLTGREDPGQKEILKRDQGGVLVRRTQVRRSQRLAERKDKLERCELFIACFNHENKKPKRRQSVKFKVDNPSTQQTTARNVCHSPMLAFRTDCCRMRKLVTMGSSCEPKPSASARKRFRGQQLSNEAHSKRRNPQQKTAQRRYKNGFYLGSVVGAPQRRALEELEQVRSLAEHDATRVAVH